MDSRAEKAESVYDCLNAAYGIPDWRPHFEPVD